MIVDPNYALVYDGLGDVYYKLGRKQETILNYQRFIQIADKKKYSQKILRAKRIIKELQAGS